MSKGKILGIILLILLILGFAIWLYTSPDVRRNVNEESVDFWEELVIPDAPTDSL